jgi:hypothetical protein
VGQFLEQIVDQPAHIIHPGWNGIARNPGAILLLCGQVNGMRERVPGELLFRDTIPGDSRVCYHGAM